MFALCCSFIRLDVLIRLISSRKEHGISNLHGNRYSYNWSDHLSVQIGFVLGDDRLWVFETNNLRIWLNLPEIFFSLVVLLFASSRFARAFFRMRLEIIVFFSEFVQCSLMSP